MRSLISMLNGKLYLQSDAFGPEPAELLPESETSFFVMVGDITFSFEKNGKAPPKMFIQAGAQRFVAKRVR